MSSTRRLYHNILVLSNFKMLISIAWYKNHILYLQRNERIATLNMSLLVMILSYPGLDDLGSEWRSYMGTNGRQCWNSGNLLRACTMCLAALSLSNRLYCRFLPVTRSFPISYTIALIIYLQQIYSSPVRSLGLDVSVDIFCSNYSSVCLSSPSGVKPEYNRCRRQVDAVGYLNRKNYFGSASLLRVTSYGREVIYFFQS